MEQHRAELVAAMVHRLGAELPSYAGMTTPEPEGPVLSMSTRFVDYYIEAFRRRELPDPAMLAPVRQTAERRATAGVPMEEVMSAFHIGAAVVTEHLARLAGPDDAAAIIAIQALGLDLLRLVAVAVATGYSTERQSVLGEELATRQTLVADLLGGTATDESALRAGIRLPPAYIVVAFSLGARGVLDDDDAARRAIRRIRVEATRIVEEPVLWASPRSGWLAFVPYPAGSDWFSMDDRVWLALTHRQVQAVIDLPIYTGWAAAPPPKVPEAAKLARDVCDVVLATHRPPGIYELDDVLIDYQLMRPSPARERLQEMLTPLRDRPDLLLTLRTYLDTGRDRRRTAQLLHLHPNSVDNRLRRCADVTGLDATQSEEAMVIRAALLAWPAQPTVQPR
ncbi:helix-turn-helix domain-containing protein [Intrasporangium sp. DVR]